MDIIMRRSTVKKILQRCIIDWRDNRPAIYTNSECFVFPQPAREQQTWPPQTEALRSLSSVLFEVVSDDGKVRLIITESGDYSRDITVLSALHSQ